MKTIKLLLLALLVIPATALAGSKETTNFKYKGYNITVEVFSNTKDIARQRGERGVVGYIKRRRKNITVVIPKYSIITQKHEFTHVIQEINGERFNNRKPYWQRADENQANCIGQNYSYRNCNELLKAYGNKTMTKKQYLKLKIDVIRLLITYYKNR